MQTTLADASRQELSLNTLYDSCLTSFAGECRTHLLSSFSELVSHLLYCFITPGVCHVMGPFNNAQLSFLSSTQAHLSNRSDQFRSAGQPSGQSVQHRDRLHEALVGLPLLQVLPLWRGNLQETQP